MAINLHRSNNHSDWAPVDHSERNRWQRVAAATHGIVTPGNAVSFGGALLVGIGLLQLMTAVTLWAVLFVACGRLADAVDGYIADKTSTKSAVGEAIDSSMDKLVAAATLIIIFAYDLLPLTVIVVIGLHTFANSIIAIIARFRRIEIHPSLYGKLATFLIWVTILAYLLYYFVEYKTDARYGAELILAGAWVLFVTFACLAAQSTFTYYKQVKH